MLSSNVEQRHGSPKLSFTSWTDILKSYYDYLSGILLTGFYVVGDLAGVTRVIRTLDRLPRARVG